MGKKRYSHSPLFTVRSSKYLCDVTSSVLVAQGLIQRYGTNWGLCVNIAISQITTGFFQKEDIFS